MEAVSLRKIILIFGLVICVIIFGVSGYMFLEGKTFMEAIWMTMQTVTTVGYGDVIPLTTQGKIFTMFLITGGVGTFAYSIGNLIGLIVEGHLLDVMGRKKMLKRLSQMNNHIIICGAGRVGEQIIETLTKENVPFVAIDENEEIVNDLVKKGILAISGDATLDETLHLAGIERAKGLVASLPGDAENVFITLTSKGLNPNIHVVSRSYRLESEQKLKRAGADKVISPSVIGGRKMAISILKPASVEFVDTLMHKKNIEIEMEEILVGPNSSLVNQSLRNSNIRSNIGVNVIAIMRNDEVISNPPSEEIILLDDLLIAIGTREQLAKLESLCTGRSE